MNILYMVFGDNTANHMQAAFSVYSFLTHESEIDSINIVTDNAAYYNHLAGKVNIIEVDAKLLLEWRGEYDFFWRIKIKAIELVAGKYPGKPVVYLDSDTFLYHGFREFKERLAKGHAFMHENEGALSKATSKTERLMWTQVKDKKYGDVAVGAHDCMWNAGVVATPNTAGKRDVLLALHICDEMCRQGVTRRLIEQFALSLSLSHVYGVAAADAYIAHYWSNKPGWNAEISNFMLSRYFFGQPHNDIVLAIKNFPFSKLPVKKKEKSTKERMQLLLEKLFPPKEIKYLK